jgi:uncharacterized protein
VLERLHSDIAELASNVPVVPQPKKSAPLAKVVQQVAATDVGEGSSVESHAVPDTTEGVAVAEATADALATEEAAAEASSHEPASSAFFSAEEVAAARQDVTDAAADAPATQEAEAVAPRSSGPTLAERAAQADAAAIAAELQAGELLTHDILQSLARPGRDPREDLPPPIFRRGIMKLEDLQPGMELQGTVLNVVDFGAFVDIGLSDSGLVHISRLADRYVRDPHEVVGVGDVLKVWVVDVDKQRRRVSLTAIEPGTERPPQPKREKRERGPRKFARRPQGQGAPAGAPQPQQQGGPPPAQGGERRPPRQRPPRPQSAPATGSAVGTAPAAGSAPPPSSRPPFRGGGMGNSKEARGPAPTVGSKKMLAKQLKVKKKVKPKAGLTKAMEEGREAMKSFSDLLQFMKKKDDDDDKK